MDRERITGYHMTNINNVKSILEKGFVESKASKGHWLGKGIYFFDNLYYTVEWGIIGVIKHEIKQYEELENSCAVIVVELDTKNYEVVDFSDPQGYAIFEMLLNTLKKYCTEEKYQEILNRGYAYVIKMIEELEIRRHSKLISKFDIICAVYPKNIVKKRINRQGDFVSCIQKQICVKNNKVIINVKELKHSEITKGIFKLVKKNRGEKNG